MQQLWTAENYNIAYVILLHKTSKGFPFSVVLFVGTNPFRHDNMPTTQDTNKHKMQHCYTNGFDEYIIRKNSLSLFSHNHIRSLHTRKLNRLLVCVTSATPTSWVWCGTRLVCSTAISYSRHQYDRHVAS